MMVDALINHVVGISSKQRQSLVGEKPIGAKLDILTAHLADVQPVKARSAIQEFITVAAETKSQRNRCFHGVWGLRTMSKGKVVPAAQHFKNGNDPVRATQLPALEKKLCKTARLGMSALNKMGKLSETGCNHLFHGQANGPPAWLSEWREQHPVGNHDLDRRWKQGQLPYLAKPR